MKDTGKKILFWIRLKIMRICGHEYACCDKITKKCETCVHVRGRKSRWTR